MSAADWAGEVLDFWFGPATDGAPAPRAEWFNGGADFDRRVRERFLPLWRDAMAALPGFDGRIGDARAALALIVLLDQFPRNMFRGTAQAFASDGHALAWAKTAVERGWDRLLLPLERAFVYLPFEHSEDPADQQESVRLFTRLQEEEGSEPYFAEMLEYARRHRDIIARFGRFPHRNAILGRADSPEETDFLQTAGSSF